MFDKFINGREPGDWASWITDREKLENSAGESYTSHLNRDGPLGTAWSEGSPRKMTGRTLIRMKGNLAMMPKSSSFQVCDAKRMLEGLGQTARSIAILCLLFSAVIPPLHAATDDGHLPHLSARKLVEDVARKEEGARRNPQNYYKFVQKETTHKGSTTSIRIETPQGDIGEVVSVNGKPPSRERCRANANSLTRLGTDPQAQRRRLQEQKEQTERAEKVIAAVPEAFIFQYQRKQQGRNWIEIKFRPNPRFQPQSDEASLLEGMRGTLWVDPTSHRLAKIEGTLFKDVRFGWGFLATLHRGGHFSMQQSEVPGGSWKQTFLEIDLDGSKLVFGSLHVHFKDRSHSFARLVGPPPLAEAVKMLEHSPTACRESHDQEAAAQARIR